MPSKKGNQLSKKGSTVGITLRIDRDTLAAYQKIANRLNRIALRRNMLATTNAQDVIRAVLGRRIAKRRRGIL